MLLLSYLLTPVFFFFFGLNLGIFHFVQVTAFYVFGKKAHAKTVAWLNFCLMSCLYILGTRIRFSGFRPLPTNRPVLFISNHQSMWDIPPIIWKVRKNYPKFIAKASLSRFIPSISFNLQKGPMKVLGYFIFRFNALKLQAPSNTEPLDARGVAAFWS